MLRTAYNEAYRMPHDPALGGNEPYDKELAELRDVNLPTYKERIRHAKEQAQERFREDFLAKLKSNIDTVKRQIDELNAALKESSFGRRISNGMYGGVGGRGPDAPSYPICASTLGVARKAYG
jgi:hypothetical protein